MDGKLALCGYHKRHHTMASAANLQNIENFASENPQITPRNKSSEAKSPNRAN